MTGGLRLPIEPVSSTWSHHDKSCLEIVWAHFLSLPCSISLIWFLSGQTKISWCLKCKHIWLSLPLLHQQLVYLYVFCILHGAHSIFLGCRGHFFSHMHKQKTRLRTSETIFFTMRWKLANWCVAKKAIGTVRMWVWNMWFRTCFVFALISYKLS